MMSADHVSRLGLDTLLVLRTIRSEANDRNALVPHVAVTLALLLLARGAVALPGTVQAPA